MFPRLATHLNVSLPVSNIEWTGVVGEQRGETSDAVKYFMHGYGVVMDNGQTKVDFDLGERGEIDGFDRWRLQRFVEDNSISTPLNSEHALKQAFEEAVNAGELNYSGYILYYLQPNL